MVVHPRRFHRQGVLHHLLPVSALLTSVALLLAGNGLLGTLLAVRGRAEGFDDGLIGLVMSGYFVGFFVGTFLAPPLVARIGHIRSFAFYAALAACTALAYPLLVQPVAWLLLRVVTGIALVGLCTVIEGWLNAQAAPEYRSRVFAAYMTVSLLALAFGQLMLDLQPPRSFVLFSAAAILMSLAAMPVTASRLVQPTATVPTRVRLRPAILAAPTAAAGALIAGLVLGAFWGMGPVFAEHRGLDRAGVGMFMGLAIAAGAFLQFPVGRLSDLGDRRTALAAVAALAAAAVGAALLPGAQGHLLLLAFSAFGGLAFTLYPLCVAHLLDRLPQEELMSGCSALLLLNGIGAAIGPALAGGLMARLGPNALPAFFLLALLLFALLAGGRRLLRARHLLNPARFHPMLRTTPTVLELLPEIPDAPKEGTTP